MKRMALAVTGSLLLSAATGMAQVNCAQVNRYLQTGRTPEDVADTMVIPIDEVKKCQAEAQQAPAGSGATGGSSGSGASSATPSAAAGQ